MLCCTSLCTRPGGKELGMYLNCIFGLACANHGLLTASRAYAVLLYYYIYIHNIIFYYYRIVIIYYVNILLSIAHTHINICLFCFFVTRICQLKRRVFQDNVKSLYMSINFLLWLNSMRPYPEKERSTKDCQSPEIFLKNHQRPYEGWNKAGLFLAHLYKGPQILTLATDEKFRSPWPCLRWQPKSTYSWQFKLQPSRFRY